MLPSAYRHALRILPRAFREEFGAEMQQDLNARLARTHGHSARFRVWLNALSDVVRAGVAERRAVRAGMHHRGMRAWVEATGGGFATDVRIGARMLMRRPAYALVAVLTLGAGIGTVTTLFSVVEGVLLRPLPYRDGDRLVLINSPYMTPENASEWLARQTVAEAAAVYGIDSGTAMTPSGAARVRIMPVGAGFFDIIGAPSHEGRMFVRGDHAPGAPPVVLVSEMFRRTRMDGASITGQLLTIDGRSFQVVGILPADFSFRYESVDVWAPAEVYPTRGVSLVARLPNGVSPANARTRLAPLAERLATPELRKRTEGYRSDAVNVDSVLEHVVGDVRRTLWTLFGAAGVVLLLSAANVATLSIGNALARREELAVRAALGAARGRLLRMLTAESLVLAFAGAVLGLCVASLAPTLLRAVPDILPRREAIYMDWKVVAFALAAASLMCVVFGVLPGIAVSRWNETQSIRAAITRGKRAGLAQSTLVVIEIAAALVLVVGAALLVRTYVSIRPVSPGFRIDNRVMASIELPRDQYADARLQNLFVKQLQDRIRELPGSPRAEIASDLPFTGMSRAFPAVSRIVVEPRTIHLRATTPAYLGFMEMPMRNGRGLRADDRTGAADVGVINETAALRYFGGTARAVGQPLTIRDFDADRTLTVVGVVRDSWFRMGPDARPEVFVPITQWPQRRFQLVIESTKTNPIDERTVREFLSTIDPRVPVIEFATLRDIAAGSIELPRFQTLLLVALTVVALFLAAVGCFAVLTQLMGRRLRELAIRMALGARAGNIAFLMFRRVVLLAASGITIGIGVAVFATRLLESALYGVKPGDPVSFAAASITLCAVVLSAAARPIMRAVTIDPVNTLKDG